MLFHYQMGSTADPLSALCNDQLVIKRHEGIATWARKGLLHLFALFASFALPEQRFIRPSRFPRLDSNGSLKVPSRFTQGSIVHVAKVPKVALYRFSRFPRLHCKGFQGSQVFPQLDCQGSLKVPSRFSQGSLKIPSRFTQGSIVHFVKVPKVALYRFSRFPRLHCKGFQGSQVFQLKVVKVPKVTM